MKRQTKDTNKDKKLNSIQHNPSGQLVIPHNADLSFHKLPTLHEATDDFEIYENKSGCKENYSNVISIKKGEKILIVSFYDSQPNDMSTSLDSTVYKIITFKKEKTNGNDEFETDKVGYAQKNKITPLLEKINIESAFENPIFPHPPCMNDIRQGDFGDCYLLACLLAILKLDNGPDFIESMMRQDFDNHSTTVRLYRWVDNKLEPVYIVVPTSYHCKQENGWFFTTSTPTSPHNAPWVHMLEKAFAIAMANNTKKSDHASYDLAYGNGAALDIAMPILTGNRKTKIIEINFNKSPIFFGNMKYDFFKSTLNQSQDYTEGLLEEEKFYTEALEKANTLLTRKLLINVINPTPESKIEIKLIDTELIELRISERANRIQQMRLTLKTLIEPAPEWLQYLITLTNEKSNELLERLKTLENELRRIKQSDAIEKLNALCRNEFMIPDAIYTRFLAYINKVCIKDFTEFMPSDEQQTIFGEIKAAIDNKNLVVAETPKYNKDEPIGLTGPHAYTIIAAYEKTVHTSRGDIKKYMLKLMNPWGKIGPDVSFNSDGSVKVEVMDNGEFEYPIELFCRNFHYVTITDSLNQNLIALTSTETSYNGANVRDLNFSHWRNNPNAKNKDFTGADFSGANCMDASFSTGSFPIANVEHANFEMANFLGADLTGISHFDTANWVGCNLIGAKTSADFENHLTKELPKKIVEILDIINNPDHLSLKNMLCCKQKYSFLSFFIVGYEYKILNYAELKYINAAIRFMLMQDAGIDKIRQKECLELLQKKLDEWQPSNNNNNNQSEQRNSIKNTLSEFVKYELKQLTQSSTTNTSTTASINMQFGKSDINK